MSSSESTNSRPAPPANSARFAASIERDSVYDPLGIEEQYAANVQAARRDGFEIPNNPAFRFSDNDTSGADETREGLDRLLKLAVAGDPPFSRVYVKDQTRFGRWTDPRFHFFLEVFLEQHGVTICYGDQPGAFDPSEGVTDENIAHYVRRMFGAIFSSHERKQLIRRITEGMRQKVINGFYPAGGKAPYATERWLVDDRSGDYVQRVPEGQRLTIPGCRYNLRWTGDEAFTVMQDIFSWIERENVSFAAIARRLNEREVPTPSGRGGWSGRNVSRLARHPMYVGDLIWGRTTRTAEPVPYKDVDITGDAPILYRNFFPGAPINRRQWNAVQEILDKRKPKGRHPDVRYPLSGLIVCQRCGGAWHGFTSTKQAKSRRRYYRHTNQSGFGDCQHGNRYIRSSTIEEAVFDHLLSSLNREELDKQIIAELERLEGASSQTERARRRVETESALQTAEKRLERNVRELMATDSGAVMAELRRLNAQEGARIEQLRRTLLSLEQETEMIDTVRKRRSKVLALLGDKIGLIRSANPQRRRLILETLLEKVRFDPTSQRIEIIIRPL